MELISGKWCSFHIIWILIWKFLSLTLIPWRRNPFRGLTEKLNYLHILCYLYVNSLSLQRNHGFLINPWRIHLLQDKKQVYLVGLRLCLYWENYGFLSCSMVWGISLGIWEIQLKYWGISNLQLHSYWLFQRWHFFLSLFIMLLSCCYLV